MRWLILLVYAKEIAESAQALESITALCIKEKRMPNAAEEAVLMNTAALLLKIGVSGLIDKFDIDSITKAIKDEM